MWRQTVHGCTSQAMNDRVKLRYGLAAGFAVGYYLGTKAGRERYRQLRRVGVGALRSPPADLAAAKARAALDLGVERLRDLVEARIDQLS